MKNLFRVLVLLAMCVTAIGQQSYVLFLPSPTGNPFYGTNLANVVISNVTFHGKVTFINNSNSPSLWNTNGAGLYSTTDSTAQSLQFGNSVAGGGFSIVFGTQNTNHANSIGATIGGGVRHYIASNAYSATVSGGTNNWIETNALGSTISGGRNNVIRIDATVGTIGGGQLNEIRAGTDRGTISGGNGNIIGADSDSATIGGGSGNSSTGIQTTVGGGNANLITAANSTIAGGTGIQVNSSESSVGGGQGHVIRANGSGATIGGGLNNTIGNGVGEGSAYSTIGGGNANVIQGNGSGTDANVIGGGQSHLIDRFATSSFIGGGSANTILGLPSVGVVIAGGANNRVTGALIGSILGGVSNSVEASYAMAIGNFITNQTANSIEIGADNASKTRFDVNGITALKLITATNGFASYSSNLTAVTSVALSGTPAFWTNTLTKNVQAVWSGGTVSGVGVNASLWPTPAASGYVILQPGEWLAFTNTGVPEFAWKPF